MNSETGSGYDPFANIYNRHWGNTAERFLSILQKLAGENLKQNSCILDVCCGTGQLAALLEEKGHSVTGIDCSAKMLLHANINSPKSTFQLHDARDFQFPITFDLVVSTYDSLNHIMESDGLLSAFQNIYNSLKTDGYFLFDMNMEKAYIKNWNGPLNIIEDEQVCAIQTQYNQEEKIAEFNVTLMSKENETWNRSDFQLLQRCYSAEEITSLLKSTGFSNIQAFSFEGEQHRILEESDERAFFLACKSS